MFDSDDPLNILDMLKDLIEDRADSRVKRAIQRRLEELEILIERLEREQLLDMD